MKWSGGFICRCGEPTFPIDVDHQFPGGQYTFVTARQCSQGHRWERTWVRQIKEAWFQVFEEPISDSGIRSKG